MKVNIDSSLFTREGGAFGNVVGTLELAYEPHVGDTLSLLDPANENLAAVPAHARTCRIKDRILQANADAPSVSLILEDITVQSVADALALTRYLESGFGLFVNIYDEKNIPPSG